MTGAVHLHQHSDHLATAHCFCGGMWFVEAPFDEEAIEQAHLLGTSACSLVRVFYNCPLCEQAIHATAVGTAAFRSLDASDLNAAERACWQHALVCPDGLMWLVATMFEGWLPWA